jgi:methyl-accepting chemotaxis protein
MARFLNADFVEQLSRNLMLTITLTPLQPGQKLPRGGSVIDMSRENVVSGSSILLGADGLPALVAKVDLPRDIHAQAAVTSRYFVVSVFVIGLVFSAVVLLVMQKTVLSRLQQLGASVLAIGTGNVSGRRVVVKGKDQIAYLGAAINGMLDAIENSHAELRKSEQRNQAFLDAIPLTILRVAKNGIIIDGRFPLHSATAGPTDVIAGSSLEDLAGRFGSFSKALLRQVMDAITRTLETREPSMLNFTMKSDTGLLHFEARIVPGGEAEVIVVTRETTSEKRLRETQKHESS